MISFGSVTYDDEVSVGDSLLFFAVPGVQVMLVWGKENCFISGVFSSENLVDDRQDQFAAVVQKCSECIVIRGGG